jgi:hypothetical protein
MLFTEGDMPVAISIVIAEEKVPAELNDSATAKEIAGKLPIETRFSTWGDEIYFPIPVKRGSENGKGVVDMGELGYWPPGNAFCIFYGATPGSTEDRIEPASPVNPIGKVQGDPKIFRSLARKAETIRLEKA